MNQILFYGLVDVYIYKNEIGFVNIKENLNAYIQTISILTYKAKLGNSFFNYELFKNTKIFIFEGILDKIDPFSIIYFTNFDLELINMEIFLSNNQFLFNTLNSYSNNTMFL